MNDATATLVRAARRAFTRFGVDRTTMTDVAREAGVVRQTLYNTVSGRDELIEMAMIQCCEDLQAQIDTWELTHDDLGETLVEFLARAVEITGGDVELSALAAELSSDRVKTVLGDSHPVRALITASVRPILERGLAKGLLREGVTVNEAGRWLQGVLTFALLRDVHDPADLRSELRKFALPSVFAI